MGPQQPPCAQPTAVPQLPPLTLHPCPMYCTHAPHFSGPQDAGPQGRTVHEPGPAVLYVRRRCAWRCWAPVSPAAEWLLPHALPLPAHALPPPAHALPLPAHVFLAGPWQEQWRHLHQRKQLLVSLACCSLLPLLICPSPLTAATAYMIILGDCFQPLLEGHFGQVGAVLVGDPSFLTAFFLCGTLYERHTGRCRSATLARWACSHWRSIYRRSNNGYCVCWRCICLDTFVCPVLCCKAGIQAAA